MTENLTIRQKEVLKYIIQNFILTAAPIGSHFLAKETDLALSSASIRNVMADLEEQGYISHPHISAGRVPTDKGYRFYVNSLIDHKKISEEEQTTIYREIKGVADQEDFLKETSKLLSRISKQLSIVSTPQLRIAILSRIEVIALSSSKLLVIISIESGFVKTITFEVTTEIPRYKLEELNRFLNERLAGLTLQQVRETFYNRVKDIENEDTGLIRLFIGNTEKVFGDILLKEKLLITGTSNILQQPEFESPEHVRSIIELIDNEDVIIHILDKHEEKDDPQGITILIGSEIDVEKLKDYSIIISSYKIGKSKGTIGVIGPRRMEYKRVIPLVSCIAEFISISN